MGEVLFSPDGKSAGKRKVCRQAESLQERGEICRKKGKSKYYVMAIVCRKEGKTAV